LIRSKLALHGGSPVISYKFEKYSSIGIEEEMAVNSVMKSKVLSRYLGSAGPDFNGGPKVQEFEKMWAEFFKVKHAIAVNSWTSGLICAMGAIELEPGDEVIVSPWSMCASATVPLHYNAIPIFADIEKDNYCIDPRSVESRITKRTKAILAVDIFGQSSNVYELIQIANNHNLKLIFDTAQSPGATYHDKFTGTFGDIGGYSLNYHKHIQTGEGGVIVTNNDIYAERMKLIRNHAEAVVSNSVKNSDLVNMIGYNFRMGEIEAAIGIEQLKKLPFLIGKRQRIAEKLSNGLKNLKGLLVPSIRSNSTHVYYMFPLQIDIEQIKVSREYIIDALRAEGVTEIYPGYANLHLLPIFQKKIAYGKKGFPWISQYTDNKVDYTFGTNPIAEELHCKTGIVFEICQFELTDKDVDLIICAFEKVWASL
jgi:perosamine synthetase